MKIDDLRLLQAINRHWRRHYMPPSLREMAAAIGNPSTSVVARRLEKLIEAGAIRKPATDGSARQAVPQWVADAIDSAALKKTKRKPR